MAFVVLPLRISFVHWVGSLNADLPTLIIPSCFSSDEKWREWAKLFMQINHLDVPYPAPNKFKGKDGWRQWALLSLPVLESL